MIKVAKLLSGLILLALCSCEAYEPEVQEIRDENYTRAFVRQFGIMDPEHDWGFGSSTGSRAPFDLSACLSRDGSSTFTDPNNNEWKNPPGIKEWELNAVISYLADRRNRRPVESINIPAPYFVTHVGSAKAPMVRLDGVTDGICSTNMDQLKIAYADGWTTDRSNIENADYWGHVSNFNGGSNPNTGGNMVVVQGTTNAFSCRTSTSDEINCNYIIIPGGLVDYRLAEYYYVCFDFQALTKCQTIFTVKYTDNNLTTQTEDVKIDGYYADGAGVTKAMIYQKLSSNKGNPLWLTESSITSYTFKDYDGKSQTVLPDGSYDDWIIRIVGGAIHTNSDEIPIYPHDDLDARRIFVEDLAVLAENNFDSQSSDWDFNDLVFDAKYINVEGQDYLSLVIRAVGGMLPIYLTDRDGREIKYNRDGHEVSEIHAMFGVSTETIINTYSNDRYAPIAFRVPIGEGGYNLDKNSEYKYNDIRVFALYNGQRIALDNDPGNNKAPCKLCVPSYLANPLERVCIKDVYTRFPEYVSNRQQPFWENALGS